EKRIKEDVYLVPFAMTELALIKMNQSKGLEAKELLEPARHNYKGYPLETIPPLSRPLHLASTPHCRPDSGYPFPLQGSLLPSPSLPQKNDYLQPPADLGACVSLP
ncbi:hypothetical protein JTE90_014877, partial [Oedothorax gibbosus]